MENFQGLFGCHSCGGRNLKSSIEKQDSCLRRNDKCLDFESFVIQSSLQSQITLRFDFGVDFVGFGKGAEIGGNGDHCGIVG